MHAMYSYISESIESTATSPATTSHDTTAANDPTTTDVPTTGTDDSSC